MRVLHLSGSDIRGGAARGTFWLHRALAAQGVDSLMLVGRKYSDDGNVSTVSGALAPVTERLRDLLDPLPLRRYDVTGESFWTLGWLPRRIRGAVDAFAPDVVHLHWIGGGFLPVAALRGLGRPVVWTLRDMWGFTGGCHYTAGCRRYETACGACPQLRSGREDDVSRATARRKQHLWRDVPMTLVPISNWLAGCARRSTVLGRHRIEVIPNGIDVRRFRPVPRAEARAAWDFSPSKRYILFGALGALADARKGYHELVEAARILAHDCWSTRAELVVFGDLAPEGAGELALPARFLGHIDDDDRLAQLYSAGDVMVTPSLQEAFGKTLIEAMACGTPVVAFDGTGPADIVVHHETGWLAAQGNAADLAAGISWCLSDPARTAALGTAARRRAEALFDIDVVAGRYRALYERLAAQERTA